MSAKYLLPCPCGLEVAVELAQAGQKVHCVCGKELDVPTMREIRRLEPVEAAAEAAPQASAWAIRHGLLLLGTILIVVAAATAIPLYASRPEPPTLDHLKVHHLFQVWSELRQGVDRPLLPDQQEYGRLMQSIYVKLAGLALVGLLGIGCVVFAIRSGQRDRRLGPARE